MSARYLRTGMLRRRQLSITDTIGATRGPACSLRVLGVIHLYDRNARSWFCDAGEKRLFGLPNNEAFGSFLGVDLQICDMGGSERYGFSSPSGTRHNPVNTEFGHYLFTAFGYSERKLWHREKRN
jgi:hypothetical protein